MHPEMLIKKINLDQNYNSDNFHSDHKAVRSNLTELFFKTSMNKLKITIFNLKKKKKHYWILTDFGYVYLCNLSKC